MASRFTLDLSDEESSALERVVREGRFASVEDALRAGIRRIAHPSGQRGDIAGAYRSAYGCNPQDGTLGEAGAELLAQAIESEQRAP